MLATLATPGCAFFVAMTAVVKKVFLVFVLAGLGAALGLTAGPVGAIVGAGAGAVIGCILDENVDLRSGALQGSGAREKEDARWMGKTAAEWQGEAVTAKNALTGFEDFLVRTAIYCLVAFMLWIHVRNLHNWKTYGYWRGVWWHGLLGNRVGVSKIKATP